MVGAGLFAEKVGKDGNDSVFNFFSLGMSCDY